MKKNTRTTDRQKILEQLATENVSAEGTVGSVTLNLEKVRRWKKEINTKASGNSCSPSLSQKLYGEWYTKGNKL